MTAEDITHRIEFLSEHPYLWADRAKPGVQQ